LGAVFYFAMTGKIPLDAPTRSNERMHEPKELNREIPDDANRVILKAMEMRHENRYQSDNEFLEDLLGTLPPPPPTPPPPPPPPTGQWSASIIFILVFLVLLFGIVVWSYTHRTDTIYYDKDWKVVSKRELADFYRIADYAEKKFTDYYITGEVQATGGFILINKFDDRNSVFDGETLKYSKDGTLVDQSNYVNGELSLYTLFSDEVGYIQVAYKDGKRLYDYYTITNKEGKNVKLKHSDNTPFFESPSVEERKSEERNGANWEIYIKDGLTIEQQVTSNYDGHWFKIDLIITNNSIVQIVFDPTLITAYSIDKQKTRQNLVPC
jgi:hypothetical protein